MRLVDAFIPVLAVVRQFVEAPHDDAAALAARLRPLLAQAQQDALALDTPEDDLHNAQFAVAASIDETLSTCDWLEAASWQRHLLQRQFFGISNAGVAFFERLARLGQAQDQAEVEEVYVLCLSMGFKGRFGHDGDARGLADLRLRAMRRVLAHASARGVHEAAALVFPGVKVAAPEGAGAAPRRRWAPSRLSVLVLTLPVLALIALYLAYFWILEKQVHAILPLIR